MKSALVFFSFCINIFQVSFFQKVFALVSCLYNCIPFLKFIFLGNLKNCFLCKGFAMKKWQFSLKNSLFGESCPNLWATSIERVDKSQINLIWS